MINNPELNMELNMRHARRPDSDALFDLMRYSARTLQTEDYSEAQIEGALGTVFGVDTQLIDDGTYYLVETENQFVACGGWSKRKTLFGGDAGKGAGPDELLDPSSDASRIRAFFVHPDFARRGLGRILIERCERAAEAARFGRMELVATLSGERLYARAGYHAMQRFDLELVNGERMPVVSMGKDLI